MYTLTCKICGNEFENSFKDVKICEACKSRPCEVCGKVFKREWPYDQRVCSKECRHKLRTDPANVAKKEAKKKATVAMKYGVDNVAKLDEVKGKISDFRKSDECKEKIRQTSLKKYGVEHFRQSEEVKAKVKATMIERYGVDNASKLDSIRTIISERLKDPEIRAKYAETSMKHYGVPHSHMDPEVKLKTEQTMIEHFGVPYYVMLPEYRSTQATKQVSLINKAFADALTSKCNVDVEYEFNLRNKFYDLRIKGTNILIEIDPSYTHSDLPNHWGEGLPIDYHINKTTIAEEEGYRCIHIFDWDNLDKITDMLMPRTTIYARQCSIQPIDDKTSREFIQEYHLQGDARGAIFRYGLIYKGELVSVMTFGKPRYNKNYEWELLRLCTKKDANVIGGASRMLNQFLKDANPNSIISYCDKAKFNGNVYRKIGMTLHHISPPAKVWSKDNEYVTDNLLRQRGYDQLFDTNYGKGTSNQELMIENGWRSVYDCGQLVFEWLKN